MSIPAGLRRVFIKNLALGAEIGIHDHEHGKTQPIRLNVDLLVEDNMVAKDKLDYVVDYGAITKKIRALVAAGHVNLAETLAERIAALCLEDHRVQQARVMVEKLEALRGAEAAGVEIVRGRH